MNTVYLSKLGQIPASNQVNDMSNRDRVTVDLSGDWRKIINILQPYEKGLGLVRRGNEPWGALVLEDGVGYVRIGEAGRRTVLDQRKVQAALDAAPKVGQPRKGYERREVYSVRLEPSLAEYLRELGGDNLSEGVAIAGKFHQENHPEHGKAKG